MFNDWFTPSTQVPDLLQVGRRRLPLVINRNKRAKRICLRYNPTKHCINLTLPRQVRVDDGLEFIAKKSDWIYDVVKETPQRIKLAHGLSIPVFGRSTEIDYSIASPQSFDLRRNRLYITGPTGKRSERIEKALRAIVKEEITELATSKATQIRRRINRITVRDTRSRWGSCSDEGNLSFSWRLIFSPYFVLDYVVSHEVAHLLHMNHGEKFWDTVEILCPHYKQACRWIDQHGQELYRYIK